MKKNGIRVLVALLVLLAMGLVWGIAGATSQKPAWVRSGDSWDDRTKTLTINNELNHSLDHYYTNNEVSDIKHLVIDYCNTSFDRYFNQWTNLESVTFNKSTDFKKLQSNFSGCNTIKEVTFEKDVYMMSGS